MGKYIHTLKFTYSGNIYTATIEVVEVSTVENANIVVSEQNGSN